MYSNTTENLYTTLSQNFNIQFFVNKKTLKDYIKKGDIIGSIKELIKIIVRLFYPHNKTGFSEFNELKQKLIKNLEINTKKITFLEKKISQQIEKTLDINEKMKMTYIYSIITNEQMNKGTNEQMNKGTNEQMNKGILEKIIKKGDIILINKQARKRDFGGNLLKAYDSRFTTVFTHSVIVSDKKNIKIRHATMFSEKNRIGCVEETTLLNYLKRTKTESCDLLVLRTNENIKKEILVFSKNNLGKKYDYAAALSGGLRGIASKKSTILGGFKRNKTGIKNDAFNCVEIIAQSFNDKKIKHITHPNEFLEYMNIFKPIYMTTITL